MVTGKHRARDLDLVVINVAVAALGLCLASMAFTGLILILLEVLGLR